MNDIPPPLLYAFGYVVLLITALVAVSVLLNRLTREERREARARRARTRAPHSRDPREG